MTKTIAEKLARCEAMAREQLVRSVWYLGGMTDIDFAIVCRTAYWHKERPVTGAPLKIANRYRDHLNA